MGLIPELDKLDYQRNSNLTFLEFAERLYQDTAYLVPALYGGDLSKDDGPYKALFVLQDPALKFTEDRWNTPCTTAAQAVARHRSIFLEWAYGSAKSRALFSKFSPKPEDLFRLCYVTDIWKVCKTLNSDYWLEQLRIELQETPTERVIFLCRDAHTRAKHFVPEQTPVHYLPHPSSTDYNEEQYLQLVTTLD